jgi:signal transduction histidine kinase
VVRLTRSDGFAVVEITDDGIGGADPGKGTGLRGLADRVESLGGRFTVSDATGGGTVVRADLPLPPAEAAGPV